MNAVHRVLDPSRGRQVPSGLCALAIMTKAPVAGAVKTRLSPPLTPAEAAELNRCFLQDTARAITGASTSGQAQGVGVFTPPGSERIYQDIFTAQFLLVKQHGDGFGERLINAAADLFTLGFDSVCLIDSDSPTVPEKAFAQAVLVLQQPGNRVVLGPSDDGGYYLIGMKQLHRELFQEIEWSTERVTEQTLAQARQLALEVVMLPTSYDVDERETLQRLSRELLETPGSGSAAPVTRAWLQGVIAKEGRARLFPNDN